jgi:hypothetical protein
MNSPGPVRDNAYNARLCFFPLTGARVRALRISFP